MDFISSKQQAYLKNNPTPVASFEGFEVVSEGILR
jgi:hypothetical protein